MLSLVPGVRCRVPDTAFKSLTPALGPRYICFMASIRSSSWLAVLPLGLAVGFITGCAHSGRSSQAETEDVPEEREHRRSTVTGEDIERTPGASIEEILRGRIAGVTVTRTADGGIAVLIRGATSLRGGNEPLYVIDGLPIQPGPGGSLAGINPHDIESIEVLKDAARLTMYGARGANGVIVIKTKRPD